MSFQVPEAPPSVAGGPHAGDDLVVPTPERVAFRFETAGLGSRFVAQLIDMLLLIVVAAALGAVGVGVAAVTGSQAVAVVLLLVLEPALVLAAWILPEALWSGRTAGKLVMHLRVVDARGGPITAGQAILRNLFRIVDFLPFYYAAGAVVIFLTARNQRVGDLVAGTVVVRDRMAVRLQDLAAAPPAEPGAAPVPAAGWTPFHLDPALRRFVRAYAERRQALPPERRDQLAREVEPALRAVLPDVVGTAGPLAALDRLADQLQRS